MCDSASTRKPTSTLAVVARRKVDERVAILLVQVRWLVWPASVLVSECAEAKVTIGLVADWSTPRPCSLILRRRLHAQERQI